MINSRNLLLLALFASASAGLVADTGHAPATTTGRAVTLPASHDTTTGRAPATTTRRGLATRPGRAMTRPASHDTTTGGGVMPPASTGTRGRPDGPPAPVTSNWNSKIRHGWIQSSLWWAALATSVGSEWWRAAERLRARSRAQRDASDRVVSQEDAEKLDKLVHHAFSAKVLTELAKGHCKGTIGRGHVVDIINTWITHALLIERGIWIGEKVRGAAFGLPVPAAEG